MHWHQLLCSVSAFGQEYEVFLSQETTLKDLAPLILQFAGIYMRV